MIESILSLLIYLLVLGLLGYLVVYVLRLIGVPIPERVIQIVGVIVLLIVVLWFIQGGLPHVMIR